MNAITGTDMHIFRLLSLKHQLKFEKMGMRSSGGAIRPRIAAEFGLKPRATHDAFIAAVEAKILELKGEQNGPD